MWPFSSNQKQVLHPPPLEFIGWFAVNATDKRSSVQSNRDIVQVFLLLLCVCARVCMCARCEEVLTGPSIMVGSGQQAPPCGLRPAGGHGTVAQRHPSGGHRHDRRRESGRSVKVGAAWTPSTSPSASTLQMKGLFFSLAADAGSRVCGWRFKALSAIVACV